PVEDMPYLDDGTPVDIVLNPLGVPSRMNVGQILETHLGWAAAGLGHKIGDMLEKSRGDGKAQGLESTRKLLKKVYGEKSYKELIGDLSDDEVVALGRSLTQGVPMATPVFDGATEADIVELLEEAGLERSGQVILTDGRTGEKF